MRTPSPDRGAERRARPRSHELLLAATVGIVLADSSIVTLALPEILRRFDTTVFGVSWVLTVFNVVLAAAILPAARAVCSLSAVDDRTPQRCRSGSVLLPVTICEVTGSLLTADQVAELLGVQTWVYEQSRIGRIPTVTLGRYRRYRREAIEAWVVQLEGSSRVADGVRARG